VDVSIFGNNLRMNGTTVNSAIVTTLMIFAVVQASFCLYSRGLFSSSNIEEILTLAQSNFAPSQ
jgi:hypothetical protein